jgi:hypothetical protein
MFEIADNSFARKPEPVSRVRRHPAILRASSPVVASVLSLLMITTTCKLPCGMSAIRIPATALKRAEASP